MQSDVINPCFKRSSPFREECKKWTLFDRVDAFCKFIDNLELQHIPSNNDVFTEQRQRCFHLIRVPLLSLRMSNCTFTRREEGKRKSPWIILLSLSIRAAPLLFPLLTSFHSLRFRVLRATEEEGRGKDDSKRKEMVFVGEGILGKLDATLIRRNIFSPRYVCTLICYAFPSPMRIIQVIPAVSS